MPTIQPAESTIRADAPVVTLVNVFSVAPENQDRLVEILDGATAEVMRHRPGFVSANIHRSLEGTKVINYAQWESEEDFRAMLGEPAARSHMDQIGPIAAADPTLCQASRSITRSRRSTAGKTATRISPAMPGLPISCWPPIAWRDP